MAVGIERFTKIATSRIGFISTEKPQSLFLRKKDIFISPRDVVLTQRGQEIQKLLIFNSNPPDFQPSEQRRNEIELEIKSTLKGMGLVEEQFSIIAVKFKNLVEARNLEIERRYPLFPNFFQKLKRIIFPK
jgi:hypothetical protein